MPNNTSLIANPQSLRELSYNIEQDRINARIAAQEQSKTLRFPALTISEVRNHATFQARQPLTANGRIVSCCMHVLLNEWDTQIGRGTLGRYEVRADFNDGKFSNWTISAPTNRNHNALTVLAAVQERIEQNAARRVN